MFTVDDHSRPNSNIKNPILRVMLLLFAVLSELYITWLLTGWTSAVWWKWQTSVCHESWSCRTTTACVTVKLPFPSAGWRQSRSVPTSSLRWATS